ncbi:hypothetical protein ACLOAU_04510 [Niabella sp. CJ426]|uniref:hypothetical protein n=1 Tax=Niabella sp. CJ426 TaxID=3393740 RepID=UPI003CFE66A3
MKIAGILFLILLIQSSTVKGQKVVIDPVMAGITTANAIIENNSYDNIKDKQRAIERLQLATVATTEFINSWQKKIYNGLLYVSSTVNNAFQVWEAAKVLANIYELEGKIMEEAKEEPLALAFAVKYQKEMVIKAIEYYTQIQQFILKTGDEKLLMDAGERTLLLNQILESLRVIEGYAVSSYYKVRYARMNGIIKTLNPFGNFVNRDAQIVRDILSRWKH